MTPRTPVSRIAIALGLVGALSACATSAPRDYSPPPPNQAYQQPAPVQQQQAQRPVQRPSYAPPAQQAQRPAPPAVQQQPYTPPVQQTQRPAPPPAQQVAQRPAERPAPRRSEQQVAIGGTAFPTDGSQGRVPPGSRLVVRVYDAAGGDVNVRAAEGAFRVSDGLPVRYKVPVPARALEAMDLPAVAARVESPNGGVVYRNETAVLLKEGANGDIPMTLQRKVAASAVTREWTAPAVE